MTPHKHAAVIKAWADGAPIECRVAGERLWVDLNMSPMWDTELLEFRIKPEVKTYDISVECSDFFDFPFQTQNAQSAKNLRLTFTDGKLTAAEVIA